MALQTAAVVQAEAGGSYPAAALCTASIIQRMIQKMIISSKAKQRGALTMSVLSTVKSEERAICRSCTLWLNVKIPCPIFASPVPPKGRHHPLPTKPVSSRGAHRRQPGERHRATTASRFNLNNRRRAWKDNLGGQKQKSLPGISLFFTATDSFCNKKSNSCSGPQNFQKSSRANFIFHLTFDPIWILAGIWQNVRKMKCV